VFAIGARVDFLVDGLVGGVEMLRIAGLVLAGVLRSVGVEGPAAVLVPRARPIVVYKWLDFGLEIGSEIGVIFGVLSAIITAL